MKRLFRHIFQTLFLFAAVCGIALLPPDTYAPYVNGIVWGLILCLLIFTVVYIYRGHKRGLFSAILLMGLLATSTVAVADEAHNACSGSEGAALYTCLLGQYKMNFCSLKNFDVDDYVKNNKQPDEKAVENAFKYLDTYAKAEQAGFVKKKGNYAGGGYVNDDPSTRKCADEFLNKVAEYETKKAETKMETVHALLKADAEKKECWPCEIAHLMLSVVEEVSLALEETLRTAALSLLGIMFLFWILFKVLVLIGQFGTANNAEFFTDFLTRSILAVIAAALLSFPLGEVYKYTFSPMVSLTTGITEQFSTGNPADSIGVKLAGEDVTGCDCCEKGSTNDCNGGTITEYKTAGMDVGIFEVETKRQLLCNTCRIYKQTTPMVATGRVLVYYTLHEKTLLGKTVRWTAEVVSLGVASFIPVPFDYWIIGVGLIVCFSWLAFCVAFRLVDIFLRIGFAVLLTPFLIATFVFPGTRKYTKRGWDFLVHALLMMIGLSLGIALVMAVFEASMPNSNFSELGSLIKLDQNPVPNDYVDKLAEALGAGENGSMFTIFFFILLCFFGTNVFKVCQPIMEGLSGVSCGLPGMAGVALIGALRMALAPFRMVKNVLMDRAYAKPKGKKEKDPKDKDKDSDPSDNRGGIFTRLARYADKAIEKTGDYVGEQAGKAVEKTGNAVGSSMSKTGDAAMKGGAKLCPVGYGLGSIIGVPLMVVGAGLKAGGEGMKAGSKAAGEATKQTIKKGARLTGFAIRKAGRATQRAWNRMKRKIKNRIKQIPANFKKALQKVRDLPKNLRKAALRKTRGLRARMKYRRQQRTGHGASQWAKQSSTYQNRDRSDNARNRRAERDRNRKREENARKKAEKDAQNQPQKLTPGQRRFRRIMDAVDSVDNATEKSLNVVEDSIGE